VRGAVGFVTDKLSITSLDGWTHRTVVGLSASEAQNQYLTDKYLIYGNAAGIEEHPSYSSGSGTFKAQFFVFWSAHISVM